MFSKFYHIDLRERLNKIIIYFSEHKSLFSTFGTKKIKKSRFFVTDIIGKIQTGYLLSQILDISVIMISYMKTNDAITIQYQYAKFSKWPLPPSWISTYMPKVELGIIHI